MNIGFDLDGVLHPWHEGVWEKLTQDGHISSSFDTYWDKEWEVMKKEKPILFMNMINDSLMYSTKAPYFGVESLLDNLAADGHTLWYITQRPEHLDFITRMWIKQWKFPFQENLIVTDNSKRMAVIENEIELFVDDAPRHILDLCNYTRVILIERPYNKSIQNEFDSIDSVIKVGQFINGKEY